MISLKIISKKWREELTDLSDLDKKLFVGIIIRSGSHWCCYNLEKVLTTFKESKKSIRNQILSIQQYNHSRSVIICHDFQF